jgi:dihydroneopterin aldolase
MGGDQIIVSDVHVRTTIGVHEWEKANPRDIYMTLYLAVDTTLAAQTDDLDHTVDYDALTKALTVHCEGSNVNLIETLAQSCAELILSRFNVREVVIRLEKPGALDCSKSVAVQMHRAKPHV